MAAYRMRKKQEAKRAAGDAMLDLKVHEYVDPCHTLRKSILTEWSTRLSAKTLQHLAGHSSVATTMEHYQLPAHVRPEDLEPVVKAERVVTEVVTAGSP